MLSLLGFYFILYSFLSYPSLIINVYHFMVKKIHLVMAHPDFLSSPAVPHFLIPAYLDLISLFSPHSCCLYSHT